jgi:hypothetical protein
MSKKQYLAPPPMTIDPNKKYCISLTPAHSTATLAA